VRVVGGMDTLPEEYLAEGLTKEGGGRRLKVSKMYDPQERLAEDFMKEGGGRWDGRHILRRINNK
jgi:hypothetical protein